MGEIVDDVRAADVLRGGHRDIVLGEPGEELRHISAVSGDRVLARIAGLQAVLVPGECGRECCWDLHIFLFSSCDLFGVCLFFGALANAKFCTFWFV